MKDDEGRREGQYKKLFDVYETGEATIYEASKGVDWISMFPDEAGRNASDSVGHTKLIDLTRQATPPSESTDPPVRPTPPVADPVPRILVAVATIALIGSAAFLYWIFTPTIGSDRDERLTVAALAPAAEVASSPSPLLLPTPLFSPSPFRSPVPAAPRRPTPAVKTRADAKAPPRATPSARPRASAIAGPPARVQTTPQSQPGPLLHRQRR